MSVTEVSEEIFAANGSNYGSGSGSCGAPKIPLRTSPPV
jgi:hypothetical protein